MLAVYSRQQIYQFKIIMGFYQKLTYSDGRSRCIKMLPMYYDNNDKQNLV